MEHFDKHRLECNRKRATRRQCEYTVHTDSLLDTAQPRILSSQAKVPTGGRQSPRVSNGYLSDRDDISTHPQQVETISSKPLWIAKITMIKEKSVGVVAEVRIDVDDF